MKCVVWDLDGTVWPSASPGATFPDVTAAVATLEGRGVVNSVASRTESSCVPDWAVAAQVGPAPKPVSIVRVADALNIALDDIAFVDDDAFERAQVAFALPEVRVLSPADVATFVSGLPVAATRESRRRAGMYRDAQRRAEAERAFRGTREDFLASCEPVVTVARASPADLDRLRELAQRSHRTNSTGAGVASVDGVSCARLRDRFGDYGLVALSVVDGEVCTLLAGSCRAEGRAVVEALLGVTSPRVVEFVATERNAGMRLLLRRCGYEFDGSAWLRAAPVLLPRWLRVERV